MAIRKIRFIGDPCLNKVCKPVQKITPSIETLIEDMFDTMYEARGVGLAAPQVGILRRICVIDVMDGDPIILINPEIIETAGEQTDEEGCLSIPGKCASVTRADYVKVKSFDMELNPVIIEGEGLRARALQHEIDILTVCFTAIERMSHTMMWRKKNASSIYGNTGLCGSYVSSSYREP